MRLVPGCHPPSSRAAPPGTWRAAAGMRGDTQGCPLSPSSAISDRRFLKSCTPAPLQASSGCRRGTGEARLGVTNSPRCGAAAPAGLAHLSPMDSWGPCALGSRHGCWMGPAWCCPAPLGAARPRWVLLSPGAGWVTPHTQAALGSGARNHGAGAGRSGRCPSPPAARPLQQRQLFFFFCLFFLYTSLHCRKL